MGSTTLRRLAALGLTALVLTAGARISMAGGDCPPGWNASVTHATTTGHVFTWCAGKT